MQRIERYLVSWESIGRTPDRADKSVKAYPDDKWGYGYLWQVYDFMAALGAPSLFSEEQTRIHTLKFTGSPA